jgi:hypothetical protein
MSHFKMENMQETELPASGSVIEEIGDRHTRYRISASLRKTEFFCNSVEDFLASGRNW